jgi:hypothetical protein
MLDSGTSKARGQKRDEKGIRGGGEIKEQIIVIII